MKKHSVTKSVSVLLLLLFPGVGMGQDFASSWSKHQRMERQSVFSQLAWKSVGPVFQGGRVETIDSPLDQPGVIYAGFGSGSLWKTTNEGLSWDCIFSDQSTFSIGDLAISVSNPSVLYLGTGENLRASQGYSYPGTGVYKSVNGGLTWKHCGLDDTQHIGRVVVDKNNPNLVFVAAIGRFWTPNIERGLFITQDGGETWTKSLYISDSVGVVDVTWDPIGKTIYAAAWEIPNGKRSGIYKSTNLGETWERLTNGFPVDEQIGRIGLTISPSHPNEVYACLDNRNLDETTGTMVGAQVYRSRDSGNSWAKTHRNPIDNYSGFGWAFGDIVVSPIDREEIYLLGIHLLHSVDGGQSFKRVTGYVHHLVESPAQTIHLDQHDLWIDPLHPERMILGNDGGVYISSDKGNNWLHTNNIPTAEFYDIYVDSQEGETIIYGGTQDNSSIMGRINPHEPKQDRNWGYVWLDPWSGGDGFTTIPSKYQPEWIYYESQNGEINKKSMETGEIVYIKPIVEKDESPMRTHWFTPYFVSIHDPGTLYYAANKVYKTINGGQTWTRISPDLTYPEDPLRKSRALTALAESPLEAGLLYAGTEEGAVWVSRDDGINWIEISEDLPVKKIHFLYPSRHKEGRIFIVLKGMDNDDYAPYLYCSDNLGRRWRSIGDSLPFETINCIIEDPEQQNLIYVGTDRGIYLSHNLGRSWTALSYNLPTASYNRLLWANNDRFMVASTHGMSIFSCYLEPVRKYFKTVDPSKATFLTTFPGRLPVQKDFPSDLDWSSGHPAIISWYQVHSCEIRIILTNNQKKEIWSTERFGYIGYNQWEWNMVLNYEEDLSLYPIPKYQFPEPGKYSLRILGQGIDIVSSIEVK